MKKDAPVLMLEDDLDDRFLTKEMIGEIGMELPIIFLSSSEDLYSELEKSFKPAMIIMDYQAGPDNAIKILKTIKADPANLGIPVVILGEQSPADLIHECYRLGASAYIIKPASLEETKKKIQLFFRYWTEVAE